MSDELGGDKIVIPLLGAPLAGTETGAEALRANGTRMVDPTWGTALLEQWPSVMMRELNLHKSALMEVLARDAGERQARDEAYLESLSPAARRKVLALRTIHKKRRRVAALLEEHVTWRFAKERPDNEW